VTFGLNIAGECISARSSNQRIYARLTSTNGKDVDAEEEWDLGGIILDKSLRTTGDNEHVSDTAKNDTPEDHGVASEARVREVSHEHRQTVSDEVERLSGRICNLFAHAQGTLSGLATRRHGTPAVSAFGERPVDVIRPDLGTALESCKLDVPRWYHRIAYHSRKLSRRTRQRTGDRQQSAVLLALDGVSPVPPQ
jgi:hypothetical protein